jgi:rhodanese-related sulfurtransferase
MRRFLGLTLLAALLGCGGQGTAASDISPEDLLARAAGASPPLILDVRSPGEYEQGHVPGAVNIPHDQVAARLAELEESRDRDIVVYCESGRRAGLVTDTLSEAGFGKVMHLAGDMRSWRAAGRVTERP